MAKKVSIVQAVALMEADLKKAMKLSCTGVATEAQDGTPVAKGDARASWNPTLGQPEVDNILISEGEQRRHDLAGVINEMEVGDTFNFTNGIPYLPRLEFENHSAQNSLFITRAINNWQKTVDEAVEEVKNS